MIFYFFFKQKTAYEMCISDWSSDVCSSDLQTLGPTARKIENGLGVRRCGGRIANDRDVIGIFDVQQLARRLLGQAAGHFLVDEVYDLFAYGRFAQRGGRLCRLLALDRKSGEKGQGGSGHGNLGGVRII